MVLTGLSGAGKSEAVRALEDLGYSCVDNLPTSLIETLADTVSDDHSRIGRAAVVVDMRDPDFVERFPSALAAIRRRRRLGVVVIFLEARRPRTGSALLGDPSASPDWWRPGS